MSGELAVHLGMDVNVVTRALDEPGRRDELSVEWVAIGDPQDSAAHVYSTPREGRLRLPRLTARPVSRKLLSAFDGREEEGDWAMASLQTALVLEQTSPVPARQWTVSGPRLTIGREPDNDVALDDPLASRHHAELLQIDGSWSIVDRGSVNGTFVNDAKVTRPRCTRATASGSVKANWCSPARDSGSPRRRRCR